MFGVAVVVGILDGAEPAGLTKTAAVKVTASAAAASLVADEFTMITAELDVLIGPGDCSCFVPLNGADRGDYPLAFIAKESS